MRFRQLWIAGAALTAVVAFGCTNKTTVTPSETGTTATAPPSSSMTMGMLVGYKIDGLTAADMAGVRGAVTGISGCKVTNEDVATGTVTVEVPDANAADSVETALKALKHGTTAYVVTRTEPGGKGIAPTTEQKAAAEKGKTGGKTGY